MEAIQRVIQKVAPKYVFGFYEAEDLEQESFLILVDVIDKYNPNCGTTLDTFLYIHLNNRLKNFKRDNFYRPIKCPCNGLGCPKCEKTQLKVERKKNLMQPIDIDDSEASIALEKDLVHDIEQHELLSIIDKNLSPELRSDYLKLKSGVKLPKNKRDRIHKEVLKIIGEIDE